MAKEAAVNTSWVGKEPVDMTEEELRAAKEALFDAVSPAQARLDSLSRAMQIVDYEIAVRFHMPVSVPPNTLPAWPADTLVEAFGRTPAPTP